MIINYTIEIAYGSKYVTQQDRYRAEAAIDAALIREGIANDEQFKHALFSFIARSECEEHDEAAASAYERIKQVGDIALTDGWSDPDGASISLGMKL